ncbi:hypothetical protein LPB72_13730 [Hydrogenophaga crassostreae]|uniref:DUF1302 domain-containing protein n=1 Tax=Hydrogenophaga crassostreae TaxID=1763535 RepID=A0A167HJF2_9BURK|nr:DUF1302 domain-containing protein [Hydrogenophaga crassostreae]AOW15341.1 hypothetical protein LPB072_03490 [Hydrogenophaga crassostreae]OAD41298.1 hypothetical protein LPB72_13730 [Hydrogenophaga crassostreae]
MKKRHTHRALARRLTAIGAASIMASGAQAMELDLGNPDIKARWDNTVKYSNAFRVKDASPELAGGQDNGNQNDGDNNFGKGMVSNRLDVFSEFDLQSRNYGLRLSGSAWYDTVYNSSTDNTTRSSNHLPASEFTSDTRKAMGRDAELLDAFVWGRFDLADKPVTMRLGRHTLLWGETLFFGANGIAGGQAPLDLIKLLSVPNSQFKEIARPTGKLSGQVQLSDELTLGGYIGYEWEKTRLMPVGAYLSASDTLGAGAERINAGPIGSFEKAPDIDASDSGQGGLQLRWNAEDIATDFGLYAIRYHATGPSNNFTTLSGFPPGPRGPGNLAAESYRWAYHQGIRAFGVSAAKTVGSWSLAGEASIRQNTPLASSVQNVLPAVGAGVTKDNDKNPGYAVGETAHLNFSWLASLGPSFISREASFLGEIAWNTRTKVNKNADMLNPNADKSATGVRMVYSPSYRQALPGVDISPSVGLGYTWGKSSAVGNAFGVDKGGDFNIGVAGTYLGRWIASLNYVHYLGPIGGSVDKNTNVQFKQALKDRNFVTFSLRTTF